jgi:PadR family transcriptional regulator, regulatory protein AphA
MSLRHALLGMLAVRPGTGYELAQRFDTSMSNAWHASHSQIYPELARLQEAGMVEVVGEGARRSRTYAVTEGGREELRDWMLNTEPNRAQRNETTVRWFLLELLDPADRRVALERELQGTIGYHAKLVAAAEEMDGLDDPHPFRPLVDLAVRTTSVMVEWLTERLEAAQ